MSIPIGAFAHTHSLLFSSQTFLQKILSSLSPPSKQWPTPANAVLRRLAGDQKLVNLATKKGQAKDKKGYFPIFHFQY